MAVRDEGSGATAEDKPSDNTPLAFARDHLALLVPILGALIFVLRCYIVSEGDRYVALMLVAETSVGTAIRVLLLTLIPILLSGLWLAMAFAASKQIVAGRWLEPKTLWLLVLGPAALLGFLYFSGSGSEWDLLPLIGFALFPLGIFLLPRISGYRLSWIRAFGLSLPRFSYMPPRDSFNRVWEKVLTVMAISLFVGSIALLLVFVFASKDFWLPRERLVFKGEAPFTGYVLRQGDRLVILNDDPRIIIQKSEDDLTERDFCYDENHEEVFKKAGRVMQSCP
jgi:hypothetical protein